MPEPKKTSRRPHVVLESFKPVSMFLCPSQVDSNIIGKLVERTTALPAQRDSVKLFDLRLKHLEETCLGLGDHSAPALFPF